jgi:hypothetical protein
MEIIGNYFGFSAVENGKELAYIQLVQNGMSISFKEELDIKTKTKITSLCENQKDKIYRIITSSTKKGYDVCFLYLNGTYQKVAQLNYGQLLIFNEFSNQTTEIEKYVNEHIRESFMICPC